MKIDTITPRHLGGFRDLDRNRSGFASYFASIMAQDERLKGRVLNVGCGEFGAKVVDNDQKLIFQPVLANASQIDGVDPSDVVLKNPHVTEKYHALFEDAPVPAGAYDAVVSFYVLEHVSTPGKFLAAAHRALRPGGVFYGVTPHSHHPFAACTNLVEALRIKQGFADAMDSSAINRYATYNRLNSRGAVVRACRGLSYSSGAVYLAPCVQWDTYFPRPLRFVPHMYDRLLGARFGACAQQLMVKLEKSA